MPGEKPAKEEALAAIREILNADQTVVRREGLEELCELLGGEIARKARRHANHQVGWTADIVHGVWVRVASKLNAGPARFDSDARLRKYLGCLINSLQIDELRRRIGRLRESTTEGRESDGRAEPWTERRREVGWSEATEVQAVAAGPEPAIEAEAREFFEYVKNKLPPDLRGVFIDFYERDLSWQEIARKNGTNADKIRMRLNRWLDRFRDEHGE